MSVQPRVGLGGMARSQLDRRRSALGVLPAILAAALIGFGVGSATNGKASPRAPALAPARAMGSVRIPALAPVAAAPSLHRRPTTLGRGAGGGSPLVVSPQAATPASGGASSGGTTTSTGSKSSGREESGRGYHQESGGGYHQESGGG